MLRPSPNHGTQRLPNDDDDDEALLIANNKNEDKILFPAQGLNRDRCIPPCRAYYVFALTSWQCATAAEWITRVVYLPQDCERLQRSVTICILNHCLS